MLLDLTQHKPAGVTIDNCKAGDTVTVSGMIHNVRVTKWGGFIILRKSRGLLQAVVQNETSRFCDEEGNEIALNGYRHLAA